MNARGGGGPRAMNHAGRFIIKSTLLSAALRLSSSMDDSPHPSFSPISQREASVGSRSASAATVTSGLARHASAVVSTSRAFRSARWMPMHPRQFSARAKHLLRSRQSNTTHLCSFRRPHHVSTSPTASWPILRVSTNTLTRARKESFDRNSSVLPLGV